jgi:hypothetical protein
MRILKAGNYIAYWLLPLLWRSRLFWVISRKGNKEEQSKTPITYPMI